MRRRATAFATLAASGIVVLCVTVVGVTLSAASPGANPVRIDDVPIPQDLAWPWVMHCLDEAGFDPRAGVSSFSADEDGNLSITFGEVDENGNILVDADGQQVTDEETTAIVGACVTARRVVPNDSYREASQAERLEIYDWALSRQQPCLAARGIEVEVAPLTDFLEPQSVPWYLLDQYVWSGPDGLVDVDFDVLLEARLACPPMPAYLAAQGVGW